MHDSDVRPIRKGRIDKPVEFGYTAQVTDNDDGIILDCDVAPDGPQTAPRAGGSTRVLAACRTRSRPTAATARQGPGLSPALFQVEVVGFHAGTDPPGRTWNVKCGTFATPRRLA